MSLVTAAKRGQQGKATLAPLRKFPVYKKLRESRLASEEGCHSLRRDDLMPRLFNDAAIARRVNAPSLRMECSTGARLRANPSAAATDTARPLSPASPKLT